MASGVALPHLRGAAASVNSLSQYIAVFQRLFNAVDSDVKLERMLRLEKDIRGELIFERLEGLFAQRHELVHEIHYGQVGHHNLYSRWTLPEAKDAALMVIQCIKAVEALVRDKTPNTFPNRLDLEFIPESEIAKLSEAISSQEGEITNSLAEDDDGAEKWKAALAAQQAALKIEMDFIDTALIFRPVRYLDIGRQMKTQLLKSRLRYLAAVKAEAYFFG